MIYRKRRTLEDEKKIVEAYQAGSSTLEVAKSFGYKTRKTVLDVLALHGIPLRLEFDPEEIKKKMAEGGWTLLETPINAIVRVKAICSAGHETTTNWNQFQQGHGCFDCFHETLRFKLEDLKEIAKTHGFEVLSDKYNGSNEDLSFRCPLGHEFLRTWRNFHQYEQTCPMCKDEAILEPGRIAWERNLAIRGLTPAGPYVNTATKAAFVCPKGHHRSMLPSAMARVKAEYGWGCEECRPDKYRLDSEEVKALFEAEKYTLISEYHTSNGTLEIKCPKGHVTKTMTVGNWKAGCRCDGCSWRVSKAEGEIADYIATFYSGPIVHNDRKVLGGPEIDLWLPDLKIAIEYDGLVWHSTRFNKRVNPKLALCEARGIRLIRVWENEWLGKRSIVESRLKAILGKMPSVYARECLVEPIESSEARDFCAKHHLQGPGIVKTAYGLKHGGVLVAVMTFAKTSRAKGSHGESWEIVRFCSSTRVVGGASRLFKRFVADVKPRSVISYADRRWSDGGLYRQLGMKSIGTTKPNYWYVKNGRNPSLKHRFGFRKDILVRKYGADPSKTEEEITESMKFWRIYDDGSLKFEWKADAA